MVRRPALLGAYAVAAATDVALAAGGIRRARRLTKPVLMPLLAAAVGRPDVGTRERLLLAGLGLSWLGDVALLGDGDLPFSAGLGAFLAAHLCYLAAFARQAPHPSRATTGITVAYLGAGAALGAVLLPRAGRLRVPVAVYGAVLTAMATSAARTGSTTTAVGGGAFAVSDAVLALDRFGPGIPGADAVVMLTYTVAQALIAGGTAPAPSGRPVGPGPVR